MVKAYEKEIIKYTFNLFYRCLSTTLYLVLSAFPSIIMTCCASGVGTKVFGNFQYATLELIPIMLALTGLFYSMYLQ